MAAITTWDEIKVTSLQKMFLIDGNTAEENDSTRAYLAAMPSAYNEAVLLLSTTNRYVVRTHEIPADLTKGLTKVNPREEIPDFYKLKPEGINFEDINGSIYPADYWYMDAAGTLTLTNRKQGTYRITYYAYPVKVTATTPGNTDLKIDPDVAALVPLYIASQLYKDDDISIATTYRNEFEVGRELLEREPSMSTGSRFRSVTGWW